MSKSDLEEVPLTNWFDSESDCPEISLVNSTLELGVNVSSPSASFTHVRAVEVEDSSAMDLAPNIRAIWWVTPHWKRQNPVKG